jgi:hypothetical protein
MLTLLLIPGLLLWSFAGGVALEDGRIGLLFVGDLSNAGAFWLTRSDPLFRPTFVPATIRDFMLFGPMPAPTLDDLKRLIRLHMPRTYSDVVGDYSVIVFFEANAHAVGPHIRKLASAVSEGSLGLLMERRMAIVRRSCRVSRMGRDRDRPAAANGDHPWWLA